MLQAMLGASLWCCRYQQLVGRRLIRLCNCWRLPILAVWVRWTSFLLEFVSLDSTLLFCWLSIVARIFLHVTKRSLTNYFWKNRFLLSLFFPIRQTVNVFTLLRIWWKLSFFPLTHSLSSGAVELGSAGVSISLFNIISKLFNIPLLCVATSFVAEDIAKNASKPSTNNAVEKLQLSSVSTALFLAVGIGIFEATALVLGSGPLLSLMGISPVGFFFCLPYCEPFPFMATPKLLFIVTAGFFNACSCTAVSYPEGPRCSCLCCFFGPSRHFSRLQGYNDACILFR